MPLVSSPSTPVHTDPLNTTHYYCLCLPVSSAQGTSLSFLFHVSPCPAGHQVLTSPLSCLHVPVGTHPSSTTRGWPSLGLLVPAVGPLPAQGLGEHQGDAHEAPQANSDFLARVFFPRLPTPSPQPGPALPSRTSSLSSLALTFLGSAPPAVKPAQSCRYGKAHSHPHPESDHSRVKKHFAHIPHPVASTGAQVQVCRIPVAPAPKRSKRPQTCLPPKPSPQKL